MWSVYSKDNTYKATIKSLQYVGTWMGECSVSVTVSSAVPIVFEIGDYLYYRGERFEINYDPAVIKSSEYGMAGDGFSYENVKFNSLSDELTRCDFLDYVPNDNEIHYSALPTFSFFADSIERLAERIQVNLDRIYTGEKKWTVSVHPEFVSVSNVNISVNNITCWDALALVKSQFNANFIIRNRTITIGTEGLVVGSLFSYGKGNGLITIERNAESDQKIITRLRAYGSTRNMPSRYYSQISEDAVPNNMAVQHLMLPSFPAETLDPYIDSKNIGALGVREGTVFFDGSGDLEEIYPSLEGMTAEELKAAGVETSATGALDEIVSAEQITDDGIFEGVDNIPPFTMVVKDLGFDLNDYLGTESAVISMKDGMCGGRDFEIVSCEKQSDGSYLLTCNRSEDTGLGLYFPYSGFQIKSGDKFVLLNIEMPDAYIKAASQRLLQVATEYLSKNDYVRYSYTPKVDNIFMARQHDEAIANGLKSIYLNIKEGDLLMFEDNDLSISGNIVIDTLAIKEGDSLIPEYEITLRNDKAVGSLEKIQNQIDSIVSGKTPIANGGGGGGYTAAQIKSLIEAVGDKLFLSKMKDDETPYNLRVGKDLDVGEILTVGRGIISKFFAQGELGNGFILKYDEETGQSYFEVDRMLVRKVAYFVELIIKQLSHVGGQLVLSPASMRCSRVEEYGEYYRCYFENERDGKTINNEFKVGDQARAQSFNVKEGTNHNVSSQYYWRLVVGVGDNYIDLSKIDCDAGSLPPLAGDDIVQLGNRTDPERQNAIILSTVGEDAPSFKQYEGIQYYTLAGKEVTVISPKGNVITGDFLSKSGKALLDYIDDLGARLDDVQYQTDKHYTIWFYDYNPTLENYPASEWMDDDAKREHVQDIFYNEEEGLAFRFLEVSEGVFVWDDITDHETIKALEKAAKAQKTADGKIRNFVAQPVPPYDEGDRWSNASYTSDDGTVLYDNDDLVCVTSKAEGEVFDIADWQYASGQNSSELKKIYSEFIRVDNKIAARVTAEYVGGQITQAEMRVAEAVAGLYVKNDTFNSSIEALNGQISLKVSSNNIINSINLSPEAVTINASKINLNGQVTFSMFAQDTQDTINGKATQANIDASVKGLKDTLGTLAYKSLVEQSMLGETIISGGYIQTSLINADAIVAKQLQATDEWGNVLTANSTGLFITGKEGTERVRLRGDASSAYLRIKSTAGHTSDLYASGLSFTYGDYSTIITYSGITLGDDCNIKGFKLGNTSPVSVKSDTDFIRTGSAIVLPAPSSCFGKVIFTRTTAECAISSTGKNIYPRSGDLAESITRNKTAQFFISDGSYWHEFYCG